MFTTYYSNRLEKQKDILLYLLESLPLEDPLQQEIILVQSPGMAQWLQMEMAKRQGIAANIRFPMPATFIWQLYTDNFNDIESHNPFDKQLMVWHLMRLLPTLLDSPPFAPLRKYLESSPHSAQYKLYQLSEKIAALFDQYLVYRPEWIRRWEHDLTLDFPQAQSSHNERSTLRIQEHSRWQGILWRALAETIHSSKEAPHQHRAALNERFLALLAAPQAQKKLPPRIFIFGISALPGVYLNLFQEISTECDVHLFFQNPSQEYWGDIRDQRAQYLQTRRRIHFDTHTDTPLFSSRQLEQIAQGRLDITAQNEHLLMGNPLLASWGKMGRDFLYLLLRDEERVPSYAIEAYEPYRDNTLLGRLQNEILTLAPTHSTQNLTKNDRTLTIHRCHSAMREVEVLQDYLLALFNQNCDKAEDERITPKDVVVMAADINRYLPYIQAVFGQKQTDLPAIPFSVSDHRLSQSDVLVSTYLTFLHLYESRFSAEEILALLDVPAVRERFRIELTDLAQIRHWVRESGIRFGLNKDSDSTQMNYNSWQAGLERMLLGNALRENNGVWQQSLGLDSSYGLKGQVVGELVQFFTRLTQWAKTLETSHTAEQWRQLLIRLLDDFFVSNDDTNEALLYLQDTINTWAEALQTANFDQPLQIDVVADVMCKRLSEAATSLTFLSGKVNFCTLLPMRSIPFKVVCLLGMNDGDFPRLQTPESFDLMQYDVRKGDRVHRDDDRYLFLEALLAARNYFYISYVGRSMIDNQVRAPSVLVGQLLDYVNNGDNTEEAPLHVIEHTMTPFNPLNFLPEINDGMMKNNASYRTFNRQWLPLLNKPAILTEFTSPLPSAHEEAGETINIELADLVRFVENPVRFFFERQLGVYFYDDEQPIADSENFALSGLERNAVGRALVSLKESEFDDYFDRQQIKGLLPRAEFAAVYAAEVRSEVLAFQQKIQNYQDTTSESVDLEIKTTRGKIRLTGYIEQLVGAQKQYVEWRFATYKERYLIRPWIYYLIQILLREEAVAPLLITKEGERTLKTMEKTTALAQLQIYLEAYLAGRSQIQLVPTVMDKISRFMPKEGDELTLNTILSLAQNDEYRYYQADPYWVRVLAQTDVFNYAEAREALSARVKEWFAQMLEK